MASSAFPLSWDARAQRGLAELQALIRVDTTNPPGNERAAAELVYAWLEEAGLAPQILESAPGRANVVARLKGDGSLPPLLLAGHLDVVGAEPEKWQHPPFAAEVHDGYLWGRGAVDMKNFIVMASHVIRSLAAEGLKLKRDIIFAAVADEEAGCDHGSRFLVEQHPELVRAEYMLGEVGGFSMYMGERCVYPVMVAEKGVAWLKATFTGEPGHGSVPKPDTAILRLAAWVKRLGETALPHHVSAPAKLFIESLAGAQKGAAKMVLPRLLDPSFAGFVLKRLMPDKTLAPWFSALLHNTATPTVLAGGSKVNVIPGSVSVELDGRTLPGFDAAALIEELNRHVGRGVQFEIMKEMPAVVTDHDTPLYTAIKDALWRNDQSAVVVPYMIPGFTDAKHFSRLGAKCYGFSPVKFPREHKIAFGALYHGHNERIFVDGFHWGTRILYDVVQSFCRQS